MASAERDIPLILVNGRLSERSFARWRYAAAHDRRAAAAASISASRNPTDDAERYAELGAPRVTHDRQSQARRAGAAGRCRTSSRALQARDRRRAR